MPRLSVGTLLPSWGAARPCPQLPPTPDPCRAARGLLPLLSTSRCSPPGSTVACTIGKPVVLSFLAHSLLTLHCGCCFSFLFHLSFLLASVCFVSKYPIDTDRMLPHFLSSLVVSKMVQTTSLVSLGQLFRMSWVQRAQALPQPPGAFQAGVVLSHCCPPSPGFLRLRLNPSMPAPSIKVPGINLSTCTHKVLPFEPQCVRLSCTSCH